MTVSPPPAPINPAETARRLTGHSLQDPDVTASLTRMGVSAKAGWDLDALTIAAWSLRSDIAVAAADVNTALSAERVAGLMPNPAVSLDESSFLTNNLQDPTVWVISAAISFTIETADKREIRVAQARADTETRRWRLAELFWQARAELRRAVVARAIAERSVALAEGELALRQSYLDFVETQIRFGIGVGSDRLTAQTNLVRAQAQLRTARGDLATAEAQIAAAAGIAIENLPLAQLAPVPIDPLPAPETYDLGNLRELGIVNRLTVRHALADYAVTEEALRLAVARQYPDINIGPGYTYDRGDHAITLAGGLIAPLLHDERNAIDQAINVRSTAAAQFQAAQSQALGEIDTASARYRAAYAALTEAKDAEEIARNAVDEVQRRLNAGTADRGEVLTAQITFALAQRATLDALRSVADALGALEDGVQRPVWPSSRLMPRRPDVSSPE
jgi:outer membrane protein TolC